mgnify:CR=1 FL=1
MSKRIQKRKIKLKYTIGISSKQEEYGYKITAFAIGEKSKK